MNRRTNIGKALLGLAALLFVLPAVVPVQPVLVHDTDPRTQANGTELRQEGATVIAYENLSERGKELYVQALENRGQYTVPAGEGAPEFNYTTLEEREKLQESRQQFRQMGVVIDREGADDLPPADEFYRPPEGQEQRPDSDAQQAQATAERYDWMLTYEGQPDLGSTSQLLRLLAALLGVVSLGVGGYVLSSKG